MHKDQKTCQELLTELTISAIVYAESIQDWYAAEDPDRPQSFLSHEPNLDSLFITLYKKSHKESFFWQYCTMSVYEAYYETRLKEYLEDFPDSTEITFIEEELRDVKAGFLAEIDDIRMCVELPIESRYYLPTQQKKIVYLKKKMNKLILSMDGKVKHPSEEKYINIEKKEQIAYMMEMGIIDFLKNSMNGIATPSNLGRLVSKITGMKPGTAQRYLALWEDKDEVYLKEQKLRDIKEEVSKMNLNSFMPGSN